MGSHRVLYPPVPRVVIARRIITAQGSLRVLYPPVPGGRVLSGFMPFGAPSRHGFPSGLIPFGARRSGSLRALPLRCPWVLSGSMPLGTPSRHQFPSGLIPFGARRSGSLQAFPPPVPLQSLSPSDGSSRRVMCSGFLSDPFRIAPHRFRGEGRGEGGQSLTLWPDLSRRRKSRAAGRASGAREQSFS